MEVLHLQIDFLSNWSTWLIKNGQKEKAVWVVTNKKNSGNPHVPYTELVDEALCFGWIDSKPGKVSDTQSKLYFSPRKPKSNWSKVNKNKVAVLIKQGRMQPQGLVMVELAKKMGTWDALNEVEAEVIPKDLADAFAKNKKALSYWEAFPPSAKKGILQWIYNAKTTPTRSARISNTVLLAENNIRANMPKQPKKK